MKHGEMIVKVQVSQNNGGKRTLIYNEEKDFLIEVDTNNSIRLRLAGRLKAFFKARVGNNNVTLLEMVKWREW